jgi:hypothetical protein
MIFNQLQEFRKTLYNTLGNARDAVFDLMDAVLVSACIVSFVSLSQSPVFRRQWSSVYAALQDHRLPRAKVLKLLVQQIPTQEQPLLAGDASRWQRPAAKTLKDRTLSGGTDVGITVGQSYSTLAWIPEADGSWALPLRHERITSFETPGSRAAFQLKQVTRQLAVRPLAVYDRGYGNASFVNQTADIEADLLLRLASNRCVYGAPPAYGGRGAPAKHGHKLKLNDPESWGLPTETIEVEDAKLARVRVTRWSDLMPLLSWQLWLAREDCSDHPLPWQSPQQTLSPGRVAQAFASILVAIGTPAPPPKPRGKAPGRRKGDRPSPRPRYPTVKKRASKRKKSAASPSHSNPTVA